MLQSQVNTLVSTIRSDARPQIIGFLYQFVVALDNCFSLSTGESLYIEKYGDVAIKSDGSFDDGANDVSIEVKMYSDELNESHHNMLNTLYNWIDDAFAFENYKSLIIYTTQPISHSSPLIEWNTKDCESRVQCIFDCYNGYLTTNKAKIEDACASSYKAVKDKAKKMQKVIGSVRNSDGNIDWDASRRRLATLLSKVIIVDSCKNFDKEYKNLFRYAGAVSDNLREHYIQSLLGFIIDPDNVNNGWRIDYESFHKKLQTLTKEMIPQNIEFPDSPEFKVDENDYKDALFVTKLKEIKYNEVTEAIIDYAKTVRILTGELNRSSAERHLSAYLDEMGAKYRNRYANAKDELLFNPGNANDDWILAKSRYFLRSFLEDCRGIKLEPYGETKRYFSNGMCHNMANDNNYDVKWLLKDE